MSIKLIIRFFYQLVLNNRHVSTIAFEYFKSVKYIDSNDLNSRFSQSIDQLGLKYFLQIGANDGVSGDHLYPQIESNMNCYGILVEPIPYVFEKLKENYKDKTNFILENVLISDKPSIEKFYYIDDSVEDSNANVPEYYDQLGSLIKDSVIENGGTACIPFIKSVDLQAVTITHLLTKHNLRKLDLLYTDTEGHDYIVIKDLDLNAYNISIILLEHKHLTFIETIKTVLKLRKKYHLFADGADLLAIKKP